MTDKLLIPLCNLYFENPDSEFELREKEKIILCRDSLCNTPKYYLEIPFQHERSRLTLERMLLIFKLFKDKFIFSNTVSRYLDGKIIENDRLPHFQPFERANYEEGPYLIEDKEKVEFRLFWAKSFDMPYVTTYALHRFNLADYRPYCMDCFIDYITSLESLLVPDGDKGKISEKFSQRGSLILENIANNRSKEDYKKDLKKSYALRSIIIHGKKRMKDVSTWEINDWKPHINQIRNYDREIIKYMLCDNYHLLDLSQMKKKMKEIYDPDA